MSKPGATEPKVHHYVPQFYLRRFTAGKKKQLRSYRRGKKGFIVQNVRNAAAETGFYEVAEQDGTVTNRVELALGQFESEIAPLMGPLSRGEIPAGAERLRLATFVALQCVRTRLARDRYTAMINATLDFMMEEGFYDVERVMSQSNATGEQITREEAQSISDGLKPGRLFVEQHPNDHIRMIGDFVSKLTPDFVDRAWWVLKSPRRDFITSDSPVVIANPPELQNPLEGIGPLTAAEVYITLDPKSTLLLLKRNVFEEVTFEDRAFTVHDENVIYVNDLVAKNSYKWIFQHPKGKDITWLL